MKKFVIAGVLISALYLIFPGMLFAGDKLAEAPVVRSVGCACCGYFSSAGCDRHSRSAGCAEKLHAGGR